MPAAHGRFFVYIAAARLQLLCYNLLDGVRTIPALSRLECIETVYLSMAASAAALLWGLQLSEPAFAPVSGFSSS